MSPVPWTDPALLPSFTEPHMLGNVSPVTGPDPALVLRAPHVRESLSLYVYILVAWATEKGKKNKVKKCSLLKKGQMVV